MSPGCPGKTKQDQARAGKTRLSAFGFRLFESALLVGDGNPAESVGQIIGAGMRPGQFVVADEQMSALAMAILAMLPPALIVLIFQRAFVKGLVETEK